MSKEPKPGERVRWNTSQGETHGKVVKKITAPMDIKGHHVKASPEDPEFLVESSKTGAKAAHKAKALKEE
jgi:Hypervirulence associated proteins TUDOR domain